MFLALPTSKYAELNVYLEAYKMGIIDKVEVLKQNPEIFDKEGILRRFDEIDRLTGLNSQLEQTIKDLQGDLQTARRESVTDRKRVEVQKFKSQLDNIKSDAKADKRISANELTTKVRLEAERLQRNIEKEQRSMMGMDSSPVLNEETS